MVTALPPWGYSTTRMIPMPHNNETLHTDWSPKYLMWQVFFIHTPSLIPSKQNSLLVFSYDCDSDGLKIQRAN